MTTGQLADHIKLQKAEKKLDEAKKREGKLKVKFKQTKLCFQKLQKDSKELKDQLVICRQNLRTLGAKSSTDDREEQQFVSEAVEREIKRRRTRSNSPERPATTQDHRSLGKQNIMSVVKDFKNCLQHWNNILLAATQGKRSVKLHKLAHREDFIDGFLLAVDRNLE